MNNDSNSKTFAISIAGGDVEKYCGLFLVKIKDPQNGNGVKVATTLKNCDGQPIETATECSLVILGRELGPSGGSPNQSSRWKFAFSPPKHV